MPSCSTGAIHPASVRRSGYLSFPGGSNAYRLVLQHTAEAGYGVSFEVGEVNQKIIVCQMAAYEVVLNVCRILYGQLHFTFLVHQIHIGNVKKTVVAYRLPMACRIRSSALISSVAFHDGSVHLVHKVGYE